MTQEGKLESIKYLVYRGPKNYIRKKEFKTSQQVIKYLCKIQPEKNPIIQTEKIIHSNSLLVAFQDWFFKNGDQIRIALFSRML